MVSRSWSRTGRAPPAISAPKRWCALRPTAIRCSWSGRRMRSAGRSVKTSASISYATSRRSPVSPASRWSWWSTHRCRPRPFPELIAACQGQSGQDQDGLDRQRQLAARHRRVVQDDDRGRRGWSCTMRGGGPALKAMVDGPGGDDVRADVGGDRADQVRQVAGAGGDHGDALAGAAGGPDHGRFGAGLRGERGDRHRRAARRHAGRDRRPAQQRDQRGLRRSRDEGPACRHRRRRAAGLARRLRQAHRRRNREVGQGDQVFRTKAN